MRRLCCTIFLWVALMPGCWPAGQALAASASLAWDPYAAPADFKEFRFYRAVQACTVQGPLQQVLTINGVPATLGKNADGSIPNKYVDGTVPAIDGDICYEITAVDTAGNESPHSNRATKTVNWFPPAAPAGLTVTGVTP